MKSKILFNYSKIIIILAVFITPYFIEGWWKFLVATIIILSLGKPSNYGLIVSKNHLISAIILILTLFILCRIIILENANSSGIDYLMNQYSFIWCITIFFQVLNEEMILRGMLLQTMLKKFKSKFILIFLPAVLFMSLHYLFYYSQGCKLNINALTFILLFGIIGNMLFIAFEHIWFGFALHFSWNLTRFTGSFLINGVYISEGESFNIIEGNINNLLLLFVILIVVTLIFNYKSKNINEALKT